MAFKSNVAAESQWGLKAESYLRHFRCTKISSTEKEGNIKIEDSTNENLSDIRSDDNENDSVNKHDDSIMFCEEEEEETKQKVLIEVKVTQEWFIFSNTLYLEK